MNRAFKFRVWDSAALRFCNLNELYFETMTRPDSESGIVKFHGRLATSFCGAYKQGTDAIHILPEPKPFYNPSTEAEKYVIQQSTCLKDKSGKEIYEGDIIFADECSFEVFFDLGMFLARQNKVDKPTPLYEFCSDYPCEVIGNIFQDMLL